MLRSIFHPFNASKLKAALQMGIHRLRLVKNKQQEQVRRERQPIIEALREGKVERARTRAEAIVRKQQEETVYDMIEDACDILVQRMAVVQNEKQCPDAIKQHVCTLVWAANKLPVKEMRVIRQQLVNKYGTLFAKENQHEALQWVRKDVKSVLENTIPSNRDVRELLLTITQEAGTMELIPQIHELLPDETSPAKTHEKSENKDWYLDMDESEDDLDDEYLAQLTGMIDGGDGSSDDAEHSEFGQRSLGGLSEKKSHGSAACAYAPAEQTDKHKKSLPTNRETKASSKSSGNCGQRGESSSPNVPESRVDDHPSNSGTYDHLATRLALLKGKDVSSGSV